MSKLTQQQLAEKGGITPEQLVKLLSTPEGEKELETIIKSMFDYEYTQQIGQAPQNRQQRRKFKKQIKSRMRR